MYNSKSSPYNLLLYLWSTCIANTSMTLLMYSVNKSGPLHYCTTPLWIFRFTSKKWPLQQCVRACVCALLHLQSELILNNIALLACTESNHIKVFYPVLKVTGTSNSMCLYFGHQLTMANRIKNFCLVYICNHYRVFVVYCNCPIIYGLADLTPHILEPKKPCCCTLIRMRSLR